MSEFKKCPKGHYYSSNLEECPFCNGQTIKQKLKDLPPGTPWFPETAMCYAMPPPKVPPPRRRLVGWLVSYTIDEMGVSFELYEGRNIIGRDTDCNIAVANDNMMSGKHATLLFRENTYSVRDEMSAHYTFVNNENIEIEAHILKDGDEIRMGNTVFLFRSSLKLN